MAIGSPSMLAAADGPNPNLQQSGGSSSAGAGAGSTQPQSGAGVQSGSGAGDSGTGTGMSQPSANAASENGAVAPSDTSTMAGLAPAGEVAPWFKVTPENARRYMTVVFNYRIPADLEGPCFLHCLASTQPDNTTGIGYKDLAPERRVYTGGDGVKRGVIEGSYSLRIFHDATYQGAYSFRIFGPKSEVAYSAPPLPGAQDISAVVTRKLYDAGRFTYEPYATSISCPAEAPPRRRITITWTDASVHPDAWIGLFKRSAGNQYPVIRRSFVNLSGSWEVEAPSELGDYDVRTFIDAGSEATGSRGFKVTWGTVKPVLSGFPAACYPNASMPVSYANGPAEINAWIGIFDETNSGADTRWSWYSLQGKTSGDVVFTAPSITGRYDIRIVDSAKNVLARSSVFQVVSGSAAIRLQGRYESGRAVLTWNNPTNYQTLDGYYVYRGTAAGAESTTALTTGPIPADRSAAAATAVNTHIDSGPSPGSRYYYIVRPLAVDHTTLGAASNEVMIEAPAAATSGTPASPNTADPASSSSAGVDAGSPGSTTIRRPVAANDASVRAPVAGAVQNPTGVPSAADGRSRAAPILAAERPPLDAGVRSMPTPAAGAVTAPGSWSEFGRTYRIGEDEPILFALDRAEYEAGRLVVGASPLVAKAGEKLLVAHFRVANPRRETIRVDSGRFEWTVVDAAGTTQTGCVTQGPVSSPDDFQLSLEPGATAECFVVIRTAGAGELRSLSVRNRASRGPSTARYDLRGKVRALPPPFVAAGDARGATVVELIDGRIRETCTTGIFDVTLSAIEVIGEDSPEPANEEAVVAVYATVRLANHGEVVSGALGGGSPRANLVDEDGVKWPCDSGTYELALPESFDVQIRPGESAEFRLRFWVRRGAKLRALHLEEPEGLPVVVRLR